MVTSTVIAYHPEESDEAKGSSRQIHGHSVYMDGRPVFVESAHLEKRFGPSLLPVES